MCVHAVSCESTSAKSDSCTPLAGHHLCLPANLSVNPEMYVVSGSCTQKNRTVSLILERFGCQMKIGLSIVHAFRTDEISPVSMHISDVW